jgi:hypothetical protein
MRFGLSQTLFALVALTASAGTALADEPAADADESISTIHGQLVPVGDRNKYEYDQHSWNFSLNPVGLTMGWYSASLSYKIHPNLVLRGDAELIAPVDTETLGFEVGVGAPIFLRRAYDGPFVEPGFALRKVDWTDEDGHERHTEQYGPQVLLGYSWTWDSRLTASIALGGGRNLSDQGDGVDKASSNFLNGYFRVGYSF